MKYLRIVLICLATCLAAYGGQFLNGGFELGTFANWIEGGGYWSGGAAPSPTAYLPGGAEYNMAGNRSAIVGVGTDPITGLPMVYNGLYAARINDSSDSYHVSAISQTVPNYTDAFIYFEWAAVLEESHDIGNSDYFALKLTDDTQGDTLYSVSYSSASTPGYFKSKPYGGSTWFYSDWQVQVLDVSARQGHTFTLTLVGSDCPYGGHGGYVYLDGFGSTVTPPDGAIPEPSTMSLLLLGGGAFTAMKLRKKRT